MSTHHTIPATPENMVLGYLDATTPPVLRVASGDTVTLSSFPAGGMDSLPEMSRVPADYLHALKTLPAGPGPHFITGPVYVEGAMPDCRSTRFSASSASPRPRPGAAVARPCRAPSAAIWTTRS